MMAKERFACADLKQYNVAVNGTKRKDQQEYIEPGYGLSGKDDDCLQVMTWSRYVLCLMDCGWVVWNFEPLDTKKAS